MTKRTSVIMGGMAAAIALTAAGAANAAPQGLYGGGSTLVEKVYRDLFNAYGSTSGGQLCPPSPGACPTSPYNANVELLYVGVGSGNGVKALDADSSGAYTGGGNGSKTPDAFPYVGTTDLGSFYGTGTGSSWVPSSSSKSFYPSVSFSGSDNPLAASDVSSVAALSKGQAVIQIPGVVAAIAVPFNPPPGFNPKGITPKGGSSNLDIPTNILCGIFTGNITSWDDPAITAANGGAVLGTGTITVVYRHDSSGTTFIFSNALLNQCGTTAHPAAHTTYKVPDAWITANGSSITVNSKSPYYHSGTSFFINVGVSNLPANFYNNSSQQNGAVGGANGSGGVATAILDNVGSIGYVSPDFVLPASASGPQAANLQTYATFKAGKTPIFEAPTAANATSAMQGATPPTTDKQNPLAWGVAEPLPNAGSAYPISGFSFIDLYTCYQSPAVLSALVSQTAGSLGYLLWYYGSTSVNQGIPAAILAKDGFAPVPSAWSSLINTLLKSPSLGPNTPGTGACKNATTGA